MSEDSFSEEHFRCPACLDLLKDPVAIPCGHSYCMSCITDCWNHDDQKGVYNCPQCRQTFSPRPSLNKNTVLTTVVENLKKTKLQTDQCYAGVGDVECDACTGRKYKAVKSCLVCLNSFCQNHLEQHDNLFKGKRHNLMDATERFREMICPKHNKQLEIYCRTDQQCICYLCTMDNHKNHDTVAAVAERTEKQVILEEKQKKLQQKIQQREKDAQELKEAIKSHRRSAQTAVEVSERTFTQLISSIERSRSEVTQLIRDQEESAVSSAERDLQGLKQEIDDLKGKEAELKQLLHIDDHTCFLQSFQCLSTAHESTDSPSITLSSFHSFEDVEKTVSQLKQKLQDFCKDSIFSWLNLHTPTRSESEGTVSEEEEEDTKPFVLMPEVMSEEEDEEVLFKERTRLFCWYRDLFQWKERGVGNIKILFHPAKKVHRVLMRQDHVLKVLANHIITKSIELKPMNASNNALAWTATDYAEGVANVEQFAARFKTPELVEAFRRTFTDCQSCLSQTSIAVGLSRETNPVVYFSIAVNDEPIGRITMELFSHIVPKTSENFRALCTGEKGFGYRNSVFHRIISDFVCQGGDITNKDGTGGKSIYGKTFEDENFDVRHTGPGLLSMVNRGRDTNSSQFFITLKKAEHLDLLHVAFGFVKDGMDVLKKIGELGTKTGKPIKKVIIIDCGQL